MYTKRTRLVVTTGLAIGFGVLLVWSWSLTSVSSPDPRLASVDKLGANTDGPSDELTTEFNRLVERANELKNDKLSQYKRQSAYGRCMGHATFVITAAISLIGAWTGFAPSAPLATKADAGKQPRNKTVLFLALLAALVTIVQGGATKVNEGAKVSKDTAIVLKEAADQARKQFGKQGISPDEAAEIIAALEKAILVAI